MALITFMSDFGDNDHYVAAVKARILGINPDSYELEPGNRLEFMIKKGAKGVKVWDWALYCACKGGNIKIIDLMV